MFVQGGHLMRLDLKSKTLVPLTSGKSAEWFPSVSPDGKWVAYWSDAETGYFNLWKIQTDGTDREALTTHEESGLSVAGQNLLLDNAPSWDREGKKIYYSFAGDLWVMDADGYNPETLLTGWEAFRPFPSSDGNEVLFVAKGRGAVYNLWSLNLASRDVKQVTHYTDWNVGSPSLSPDGRKILFNLFRENVTQVYVMNADGTGAVNLTANNHSLSPRWAQGGLKVLYVTSRPDDWTLNLWWMDPNGTNPEELTTEGGTSPSWGPYLEADAAVPTPIGKRPAAVPTAVVKPTPVAAPPEGPPTPTPAAHEGPIEIPGL